MRKKMTATGLYAGAIVLGLLSLGCGGAIENAASGWVMLGWGVAAVMLMAVAIALAGLGMVAEREKTTKKVHKTPGNTVKKPACGRKAG